VADAPAAGSTASAHAGSRVLTIAGDRPPVRLVVCDETLRRNTLTVLLRLPLAQGTLRVLAPPDECWSIGSGRDERELLATHAGCGVEEIPFDPSGFEAQISAEPPTEEYLLGATVFVEGEAVRRVLPAMRGGLRGRHGDDLPENRLVVGLEAPPEGCWTALVDDAPEEGCGSRTLDLGTISTVAFNVEREARGSWPLSIAVEADGQVVQTYGPDRGEYPRISGGYSVPEPPE
jgi:hypothetical protein